MEAATLGGGGLGCGIGGWLIAARAGWRQEVAEGLELKGGGLHLKRGREMESFSSIFCECLIMILDNFWLNTAEF